MSVFCFFKQKTAYEMRISDWSSDVCSPIWRVKNLLSRGDKGPKAVDFRLDGKGRTLIPGIIDAHGHVMGLGLAALTLDLSDTNSLQEAQAKIAAYAAANPRPRWIVRSEERRVGKGWVRPVISRWSAFS